MRGVLGLDLAKTTGVAWIGDTGQAGPRPWDTWTIALNPKGSVRGEHFFAFQKRLDEVLRDWKPELVVFEEVTFIGKGRDAFRLNAILSGIVMVRCESFAIPYVGVGVSTLKKFAGHGGADKPRMAEFAREKLFGTGELQGPFPERASTDEIDSLWTAWWGIQRAEFRRSA